ncbi:histidine phosphatase family protein [Nisaea nitritireducens]|uniref:histidine phosphatase family protein n=1 Tax=Nisaea nitritireducens TaxID=568392 RepID=UPI0018680338|nr:histidine phosphatase family protein [Nisaea nitritireducens]
MLSRIFLTILMLGFPWQAALASSDGDASQTSHLAISSDLVDELRGGGFILYIRHAATDHDVEDTDRDNLDNCTTQRPLSELGRDQSRRIGDALRKLGIPVAKIVASPYCRARNTAILAFGKAELIDDLKFSLGSGDENTERQTTVLRALLAEVPADGTNTVIAGHTANLREASGVWPKPEGVTVVFEPDGAGAFRYRAAIHPDSWPLTASQQ